MSKLCNRILSLEGEILKEIIKGLDILLEILDEALASGKPNGKELHQRYRDAARALKRKIESLGVNDCIHISLPYLKGSDLSNQDKIQSSINRINNIKRNLKNCLVASCLFLRDKEKAQEFLKLLDDEELYKPNFYVYKLAQELKEELKASQLRKFFNLVKEIEFDVRLLKSNVDINEDLNRLASDILRSIMRMYPLVHYSSARGLIPKPFLIILITFLNMAEVAVNNIIEIAKKGEEVKKLNKDLLNEYLSNLEKFIEFMNSLVAYHKYFNPKD